MFEKEIVICVDQIVENVRIFYDFIRSYPLPFISFYFLSFNLIWFFFSVGFDKLVNRKRKKLKTEKERSDHSWNWNGNHIFLIMKIFWWKNFLVTLWVKNHLKTKGLFLSISTCTDGVLKKSEWKEQSINKKNFYFLLWTRSKAL